MASTAPKAVSGEKLGEKNFNGLTTAVESMPANCYYDTDWYQKELESIFYQNWLFVCHSSSISEARGFRTFNIGDQSILLVRDENNELRGYHNTCRHRGSTLCTASEGKFANRLIRCPYHQWAYSFDGQLKATSSHTEAEDFNKEDYPLFSVSVQEWRGCVFVSLGDTPPNLEDGFSRGGDRIQNWPIEQLVVGHQWQKTMGCNWKMFWENFNECLHCPNIHPELCELVPVYGRRLTHIRDHPDWEQNQDKDDPQFVGGLRQGAHTWSTDGQAQGEEFHQLTDEEKRIGQTYFVSLPTVYIAAHVDYMRTVRVIPVGPEETEICVEWLFPPATLQDPDFDLNNITEFAIRVMQQDAEASEINQRGIHSKRFKQGVLMPEEYYVKAFQDWVRSQLPSLEASSVRSV